MAKPSEQGERGSVKPPGRWRALVGVCLLVAGCTSGGQKVDEAMRADRGDAAARNVNVAARYHVRCPDVLEVTIAGQPRPVGRLPVAVDGRIDLGPLGQPRVEERTAQEIARHVAELAGVPAEQVRVRVAEYNSQQVYLFGEVAGLQRAVAYQGEEPIADLLQRAGGLTPGAAPARVQVIRPRVIEGRPPLVYNVDLEAVVMGRDQSTNLHVQPFDQIYVGETRKASLQRCIPPWLRPLYEAIFGLPARQGGNETPKRGDPEVP